MEPSGKTLLGTGNELPKFNSATPWRYRARPSEATTLPSGAALRSGRKIRVWAAQPRKAAMANARTSATTIGTEPLSLRVMRTGTFRSCVGQEVDPGEEELAPVPGGVEGEHAVHGHGALGEVDDARALVDDDQAGAQHRVERADAQAEQQEEDDLLHRIPPESDTCRRLVTAVTAVSVSVVDERRNLPVGSGRPCGDVAAPGGGQKARPRERRHGSVWLSWVRAGARYRRPGRCR